MNNEVGLWNDRSYVTYCVPDDATYRLIIIYILSLRRAKFDYTLCLQELIGAEPKTE